MAARRQNKPATPLKTVAVQDFFKLSKGDKTKDKGDILPEEEMESDGESIIAEESHAPVTKADITNLVSKQDITSIFDKMWEKMDTLQTTVTNSLAEIKNNITSLGTRVESLEEKEETMEEEITAVLQQISEQKQELAEVNEKLEDLENRNRRCNIRLKGIPESITTPDLTSYLLQLFQAVTGSSEEGKFQMERAH
ncbi:uncharacterized protein LOC128664584 [Bombina bombina]|uniref:uncharacterized protein LOC128664584 n=1 Tax=Bombina bombina TaxID=8345 RepID=UPI00235AB1AA|nr:uncharacterized protein LOC128664584 [Bombina bombina]